MMHAAYKPCPLSGCHRDERDLGVCCSTEQQLLVDVLTDWNFDDLADRVNKSMSAEDAVDASDALSGVSAFMTGEHDLTEETASGSTVLAAAVTIDAFAAWFREVGQAGFGVHVEQVQQVAA